MQTNELNPDGYEVLLYISDQHTADCTGFMGDPIVRTPNLDKIAEKSFIFKNAYTSCPLCVPARTSLLTARLPSNVGVFDNNSDYKSSEVTFAHTHALKGYDTNLIGRMHFVGLDYFHGFTKRIGKDMTPSYWGLLAEERKDLGDFGRSLYQKHCLEVVGSGDSIVLSYDRDVVNEALKFLVKDHEKPQFTVVGTYSPHFPYVGSEQKMRYYRKYFKETFHDEIKTLGLPPLDAKVQTATKEDIIEVRSAYYAMVETMDEQIGKVYDEFQNYLKRNGRKGIFIYMSDHGDQLGTMGIYGKQTFFEKSAQIPFIMKVDGLDGGVIDEAVSIMDIAPTLCEINGTEPIPLAEGKSFTDLLLKKNDPERYVISEFYDNQINPCQRGYMIFQNGWKLITYDGYEEKDMLFDLTKDRSELDNVAESESGRYHKMKQLLLSDVRIKDHSKEYLDGLKNKKLLGEVGRNQGDLNKYLYIPPEESRFINESCKRPQREW